MVSTATRVSNQTFSGWIDLLLGFPIGELGLGNAGFAIEHKQSS